MNFYDEMALTVTELLSEFGRDLAMKRRPGKYDSDTDEVGTAEEDLVTIGIQLTATHAYVRKGLVQGAELAYVLDASIEPLMTDKIMSGDVELSLFKIDAVNPAGTPLAYFIQVGK